MHLQVSNVPDARFGEMDLAPFDWFYAQEFMHKKCPSGIRSGSIPNAVQGEEAHSHGH